MRCGYWLIHGTKRRKNNQSEKTESPLQNKIHKVLLIIGSQKLSGDNIFFDLIPKYTAVAPLMIETITLHQARRST